MELDKDLHPYTHGGGFGIATEIIVNQDLAVVLKKLEPYRFEKCNKILDKHKRVLNAACAREITLLMENSPVIAALAQKKIGRIPIEWDIWLDPKEPQSLKKSLIEHGSITATLFGVYPFLRKYLLKDALSAEAWLDIYKKADLSFNKLIKKGRNPPFMSRY